MPLAWNAIPNSTQKLKTKIVVTEKLHARPGKCPHHFQLQFEPVLLLLPPWSRQLCELRVGRQLSPTFNELGIAA